MAIRKIKSTKPRNHIAKPVLAPDVLFARPASGRHSGSTPIVAAGYYKAPASPAPFSEGRRTRGNPHSPKQAWWIGNARHSRPAKALARSHQEEFARRSCKQNSVRLQFIIRQRHEAAMNSPDVEMQDEPEEDLYKMDVIVEPSGDLLDSLMDYELGNTEPAFTRSFWKGSSNSSAHQSLSCGQGRTPTRESSDMSLCHDAEDSERNSELHDDVTGTFSARDKDSLAMNNYSMTTMDVLSLGGDKETQIIPLGKLKVSPFFMTKLVATVDDIPEPSKTLDVQQTVCAQDQSELFSNTSCLIIGHDTSTDSNSNNIQPHLPITSSSCLASLECNLTRSEEIQSDALVAEDQTEFSSSTTSHPTSDTIPSSHGATPIPNPPEEDTAPTSTSIYLSIPPPLDNYEILASTEDKKGHDLFIPYFSMLDRLKEMFKELESISISPPCAPDAENLGRVLDISDNSLPFTPDLDTPEVEIDVFGAVTMQDNTKTEHLKGSGQRHRLKKLERRLKRLVYLAPYPSQSSRQSETKVGHKLVQPVLSDLESDSLTLNTPTPDGFFERSFGNISVEVLSYIEHIEGNSTDIIDLFEERAGLLTSVSAEEWEWKNVLDEDVHTPCNNQYQLNHPQTFPVIFESSVVVGDENDYKILSSAEQQAEAIMIQAEEKLVQERRKSSEASYELRPETLQKGQHYSDSGYSSNDSDSSSDEEDPFIFSTDDEDDQSEFQFATSLLYDDLNPTNQGNAFPGTFSSSEDVSYQEYLALHMSRLSIGDAHAKEIAIAVEPKPTTPLVPCFLSQESVVSTARTMITTILSWFGFSVV